MRNEDVIKSAIIGLCVGDVLGVPVEFKSRAYLAKYPVRTMISGGTHGQPIGTWSDDSSLTFSLMESLLTGYHLKDVAKGMVEWLTLKKWTPHGEVFDVGITTQQSIARFISYPNPKKCGARQHFSNGNGSLMRVLPLAFYLLNEDNIFNRRSIIDEVSSLTHAHDTSKVACVYYVEFARLLIQGVTPQKAYVQMPQLMLAMYDDYEVEVLHRLLKGDISQLPMSAIKSSGYVIDSLEACMWCLLRSKDYASAVLTAINLGEDTDTIGAITGGLAGIVYGMSSIGSSWVDSLVKKDSIDKLIIEFAKVCN